MSDLELISEKLRLAASQYDPKDPEIQAVLALADALNQYCNGDVTAIEDWKKTWVSQQNQPANITNLPQLAKE